MKLSGFRPLALLITRASREKAWFVCLVAISLVATFLELPGQVLPLGGDALPFFNSLQLPRYLSAWNPWIDVGSSVTQVLAGPPLTDAAFFSFLSILNINSSISAWLYVGLFSILGATGTAYLFRTAFPNFRHYQTAAILSGIVFLLNPSIVVDTFKSLVIGLPERAAFPWFLGLFIDGYQRRSLRFAAASSMVSILLLGRFPFRTDEYSIAILASTSAYLALAIVTSKAPRRISFAAGYYLIAIGLSFLMNAYVIIPALTNFATYNSTLNSFVPDFALNNWSTFINGARLLGHWGFYAGYVPYSTIYTSNGFVILATFTLPFFSFFTLLVNRTRRIVAMACSCGLLLFLSKGNNEPLGLVFVAITSLPALKVFYLASYLAPFLLLSYSLLTPAFFSAVRKLLPSKTGHFHRTLAGGILILLTIGTVVASWPIVTGDISTNYWQPSQKGVSIPIQYNNLQHWLQSNGGQYRMMLAYDPSVYVSTSWGFQGATQFYPLYYDYAIVTGTGTQYSQSDSFLDFIYHPSHFVDLQPGSTTTLKNASTTLWTSYQNDGVSISSSGYASQPAVDWQIRPSNTINHQIAYFLPSDQDWSNSDLLSVWVNQSVDLSTLSLGVGDNSGFVGWYDATKHVGVAESDWVQILLPLQNPDNSGFNITSVKSLWAMYAGTSSPVELSFFQLGKVSYNSLSWGKLLALAGIKWILKDDSLIPGKWTGDAILENPAVFTPVFRDGFLSVYANAFTPNPVYGATSTVNIPSMLRAIGAINQSSFDVSRWAFIINSNNFSLLSSNGSTTVSYHILSDQSYDISASSTAPFVLILDQRFDPRWTLVDPQGAVYQHVEVNGYANGWVIPFSGSFHFNASFTPQGYYSLALVTSVLATLISVLAILRPAFFVTLKKTLSRRIGALRPLLRGTNP